MIKQLLPAVACICLAILSQAQSTTPPDRDSILQLPSTYLDKVSSKASQLDQKLDRDGDKVLSKMMNQEEKMKRKLMKIDSVKAKEIFGDLQQKYEDFEERLKRSLSGKRYIASLDTLSNSLKFLEQNLQLVSSIKNGEEKLKESIQKVNGLEDKFQQAEEIKRFLKERKQFLKDQLNGLGFVKQLTKLNKEVYYYSAQVSEYKEILKDHKKAEQKAIELLSRTKLFQDFMRKNSMLASLFPMPGDPNSPLVQSSLAGLQTRAQINSMIQQQIGTTGAAGMSQFRQNLQDAQGQLNELKNKIIQKGRSSSGDEMPDGFKPNNQKTKSFWKRIELGTNTQTQKGTNFFPTTNDLGLSLGYKLNDKSVIGVGASYKLGLGRGWNHIKFTSEGAGLRSFIDWKLKGSFWISGGYEANYKTAFNHIDELKEFNAWQQSGLLGLSKVISIKNKIFKKTKLQLLWDFLSYQEVPRTQPLIFRIGYNF